MTVQEVANFLAERGMELVQSHPQKRPAPCGRGGSAWSGFPAGTYQIGSGSLTINGKGLVTAISP